MKNISYFNFIVENVQFTLYLEQSEFVMKETLYSPPHIHPMNELLIIISGEVLIEGDFKPLKIKESDICIIPPITYHNSTDTTDEPSNRIHIKFTYKKIQNVKYAVDLYKMLKYISQTHSEPIKLKIGKTMIQNLVDATSASNPQISTQSPIQKIKIKNIFSLFFIFIAEKLAESNITNDKKIKSYNKDIDYYARIIQLDDMVTKYVNNEMSFEEISKAFHACEKQISQIIKKEYETTLKTLAFEYRVKNAASLLKNNPKMPIHSIAEKVGYASPEILSIMFKKYYGISASEYRKRNKC